MTDDSQPTDMHPLDRDWVDSVLAHATPGSYLDRFAKASEAMAEGVQRSNAQQDEGAVGRLFSRERESEELLNDRLSNQTRRNTE